VADGRVGLEGIAAMPGQRLTIRTHEGRAIALNAKELVGVDLARAKLAPGAIALAAKSGKRHLLQPFPIRVGVLELPDGLAHLGDDLLLP
jgi:hypothetical protein